jgi:GT2 family glycosyltransferase
MVPEPDVAPVTVVLPTIGRPELIGNCLESLARCRPRAAEILVIDSSVDDSVERVVARFEGIGARTIRCRLPGLGTAFNVGLEASQHEIVLLTNDDCTVDPTWVGVGLAHALEDPDALVTGRVRPHGDPEAVPSTIDDPVPRTHVGISPQKPTFLLHTQCMALWRARLLEFGAFDGRIRPAAEDNDLSYRWLRAGRPIRYLPDFVVWHHDWRSREQLDRLYVGYGIGQGMFFGKHLRRGDLTMARFVARDLYACLRGVAARIVRGRPRYVDWRTGYLRGLPVGLIRGLRLGGTGTGRTAA